MTRTDAAARDIHGIDAFEGFVGAGFHYGFRPLPQGMALMDGEDDIASRWDLLTRSQSPLHPRFRRLEGGTEPPAGLPPGFTLGSPIAPGNDWSIFAEQANARGPVGSDHRVLLVYEPATKLDAEDFSASLESRIFAGTVEVLLYGPAVERPNVEERQAQEDIARRLSAADTVIYLSGRCVLDPLALERICRMTRMSRLIAVPIVEVAARPGRTVSVPATVADWPEVEPWHEVRGRNIAVSAALARLAGPLAGASGREFAYRCALHGAYFAPCFVPELRDGGNGDVEHRPRTSIIVSTEGGPWAMARTIDSVLAQGDRDIEMCVWSRGLAARAWWAVLKRRYTAVRLISAARLDDAIAATTGQVVGLLDSGDRLGPGAVAPALERFERPDVAAVRLREGTDAAMTWSRPSSDRLLAMLDTSGFVLFRRSAWARVGHPVSAASLFDALSGQGLVETTRTDQFKRSRWRRRPAASGDRTTAALTRRNLDRYFAVGYGDAKVSRKPTARLVVFWPDYSRDNAYQRLLYGPVEASTEYLAGDIEVAIAAARDRPDTVFHIHWTNRIFRASEDEAVVRAEAASFLARLGEFGQLGGSIVWTMHNIASHNTRHFDAEIEFAEALVALADRIHIHSLRSLGEIEAHFAIPRAKLRVARHGNYLGAYADYIPRALARRELGLSADDDVLLFTGSLRAYKGPGDLVAAFRRMLPANPKLRLILAGDAKGTEAPLLQGLSEAEMGRVLLVDRFLDNDELQLYLRAADVGVYPYDQVLTSGSILLALSFGLPVVAPRFGMISEAVEDAGVLYDRSDPSGLQSALTQALDTKHSGGMEALRAAAVAAAERNTWQPFAETVLGEMESL